VIALPRTSCSAYRSSAAWAPAHRMHIVPRPMWACKLQLCVVSRPPGARTTAAGWQGCAHKERWQLRGPRQRTWSRHHLVRSPRSYRDPRQRDGKNPSGQAWRLARQRCRGGVSPSLGLRRVGRLDPQRESVDVGARHLHDDGIRPKHQWLFGRHRHLHFPLSRRRHRLS